MLLQLQMLFQMQCSGNVAGDVGRSERVACLRQTDTFSRTPAVSARVPYWRSESVVCMNALAKVNEAEKNCVFLFALR